MVAYTTTLLALASSLTLVSADYWVNTSNIDIGIKKTWCLNEIANCPLICQQEDLGPIEENECNSDTLEYSCVCGNGKVPDLDEYTLTIPYHTCVTYVQQCIQENMGDNLAQNDCAEKNPCGAKSPTRSNATTTSATASKTASPSSSSTGTGVYDGLAGDGTDGEDSSNNNNKKNAAPRMLESVGATLLFGGLFAGFAVML
ncbi:unnamed protein product [Sordaria macrospora k-hell]|uniref:WGS project CABT00000000 data, contig 2.12 n=2 Tax=Sordaria macrospora TaxID=5147 RepID=F7VXX5_SORMK|nr:uncharacterized protein SMAC_02940 [Sordaria macrospora k-hell]KAH7634929.1 hypothetical protein B0T09DRAFT_378774 [Sordaria sp. MPI-SDFR-AT-0083]CCC10369.1 unnamed protein product [Sordaria macrospora k-hell]